MGGLGWGYTGGTPVLLYEFANFGDFFFGELLVGGVEESGDEVFGFAFEEGAEEVFESGAFGFRLGDDGAVKVAAAFFGVFDHVFVFEGGKEGADGGVGRGICEFVLDVLGGGLAKSVEDVEDLTFAA